MRAAYIDAVGPPENIQFGELPTPAVGPSDVLVKTTAVCVDPVDTLIRSGQLPETLSFPFIVGRDMAGVVQAVGSSVTRFAPGDRVWCNNQGYHGRPGTFAAFRAVPQDLLYPLPSGVKRLSQNGDRTLGFRSPVPVFAQAVRNEMLQASTTGCLTPLHLQKGTTL